MLYVRIRVRRVQQKGQLELREQESMQLKHLDDVKSRFFANITHEFRTPLTLILTPLEQVLQDSVDSPYYNRLSLIYRNANRLLRLINELLDLAKLDAGNLTYNAHSRRFAGVYPAHCAVYLPKKRSASTFNCS